MVWRLTLNDGTGLLIVADSTFVEDGDQVFEIAVGDRPPTLIEIARLPTDSIASLHSEPTTARDD